MANHLVGNGTRGRLTMHGVSQMPMLAITAAAR
jgi:hypothetical protein